MGDGPTDDRGRKPLHALAPARLAGLGIHGIHGSQLVGEEQRVDTVGRPVERDGRVDRPVGREGPANATAATVERQQVSALAAEKDRVARDDGLRPHGRYARQRDGPQQFERADVAAVDGDALGVASIVASEAPVLASSHRNRCLARAAPFGDPRVAPGVLLGCEPFRQPHALLRLQRGRLRLHLAELHRHQDPRRRQLAQRGRGRGLGFRHIVADRAGRLVERRRVVRCVRAGVGHVRHQEECAAGDLQNEPCRVCACRNPEWHGRPHGRGMACYRGRIRKLSDNTVLPVRSSEFRAAIAAEPGNPDESAVRKSKNFGEILCRSKPDRCSRRP